MRNRGVTAKIWMSVGVFALGYIISTVLGQVQSALIEKRLSTTAVALFPAAQKSQTAEDHYDRMAKLQMDAVMLENADALDPAKESGAKLIAELEGILRLEGLSPSRRQEVTTIIDQCRGFVGDADRTYRKAMGQSLSDGIQAEVGEIAKRSKAIESSLASLHDGLTNDLNSSLRDSVAGLENQRLLSLCVFLIAVSLAGFLVHRTIRKAIQEPMQELMSHLRTSVTQIASASQTLSTTSRELARSASSQAAALEQTSASSEEVSAMARQNAAGALDARGLVKTASECFEKIDGSHRELEAAMSEINDSSQRISKVIRVIEEIAFQTNILALNASVEAARAGQHGLGFSVVADEVRNLAHRCAESANDTRRMIEESVDKTSRGMERLATMTSLLDRSRDLNTQVDKLIDSISTASREQTHGVEEITKTLSHTSGTTQVTAQLAEQSTDTFEQLETQARVLTTVAERLEEMVGV
jgi:methyl-accepting chemotaxis protein